MQTLPHLPSLQSLRVLDAVVQRQGFSAAAKDLGLTHGAVSKQIHQLEALVGMELFRRRGGRMEPTAAALAIAARAGHVLRTISELFDRSAPRRANQQLRVATTIPFARFWLAPRLNELLALKDVRIASIETGPEPISFKAGTIDVAIRYGRGNWPGTQTRLLGLERTFPVANPNLAKCMVEWDAASIARAPLIANSFVSWHAWFNAAGMPATTSLNVVVETGDTSFSFDAALAGAGVALARARLVAPLMARGELVALSKISFDDGYAYYVAWPADSRRKNAIAALGDWLQSEFERQSPDLLTQK